MIGEVIELLLEIFTFPGSDKKSIGNFELIEKLREKNIPTYEFLKYLFIFIFRLILFIGLIFLIFIFL